MQSTSRIYSKKWWKPSLSAALLTILFPVSTAFASPEVKPSGDLPRDLSIGYFDMVVVVSNISTATGTTDGPVTIGSCTDGNEVMKKRLKVTFSGIQGSQAIHYDNSITTDALFLTPSCGKVADDVNSTQKVTFTFRVTQLATTLASAVGTAKELKTIVSFLKDDGTTEISKSAETTLTVNNVAPNAAPESFSVSTGNRKLRGAWSIPATIPYTSGVANSAVTTKNSADINPSIMMFWVEQGSSSITLDAYEFKESGTDVSSSCTLDTTLESGSSCVVCPADNIYLSQKQSDASVHYKVDSATNIETPSDLDLEKKYVLFAMYSPFGFKRTACIVAQPTLNYTLTEVNGEGQAEHVDLRCFIATAAFGSPLHHHLKGFRWFRDRVLLKTYLGRQFVRAYYHFAPPVAEVIAEHPWLQRLTRGMLYPFAFTLEGAMGLAQHR